MDLEAALNAWMDEHEAEVLDLLDEEMERFREHHPGIDEAVAELLRETASPVAVAPYLLAPGYFASVVGAVVRRGAATWVAQPLGAHPALGRLVLARYSIAARSRAAVG
jgi:sirohydrochlorin ferrochelatase